MKINPLHIFKIINKIKSAALHAKFYKIYTNKDFFELHLNEHSILIEDNINYYWDIVYKPKPIRIWFSIFIKYLFSNKAPYINLPTTRARRISEERRQFPLLKPPKIKGLKLNFEMPDMRTESEKDSIEIKNQIIYPIYELLII